MRFGIRELVLLAILVALPAASYMLVFQPQNAEISRARSEIDHKRQMLEQLQRETARNRDLQRANEEMEERVAEIEARLPSDREVDRIVRKVSDLAAGSGLEAPSLTSGRPLAAALYMEQPLEMRTVGDFDGFYEFLLRLEQLPRITRISDLKLRRDSQRDGQMNVDFTLSIYFQDEEKRG